MTFFYFFNFSYFLFNFFSSELFLLPLFSFSILVYKLQNDFQHYPGITCRILSPFKRHSSFLSLILFCAISLSFLSIFLYKYIHTLHVLFLYFVPSSFLPSTLNEYSNHQFLTFSWPPPLLLPCFTLSSAPTWSHLPGVCSRWPSQSGTLTRSRTWAFLRGSWASRSLCRSRSHVVQHGGYGDASSAGWCAGPARDCFVLMQLGYTALLIVLQNTSNTEFWELYI